VRFALLTVTRAEACRRLWTGASVPAGVDVVEETRRCRPRGRTALTVTRSMFSIERQRSAQPPLTVVVPE